MEDKINDNHVESDILDPPIATELSRTMGLLHVVMIGVGAMIGAGIFVLTGIAAGVAGPALMLVFLFNGVVTTLTALSYAELGSCFPEAGGGYLWVKQALPQPNGFLSGWMSWFAHAVACSLYAVAFGAFSTKILSLVPILSFLEGNEASTKLIAVLITLIFSYINYRGAEETGRAETIVTVIKIIIITLFCITGLWSIVFRPENVQGNFSDFKSFLPNGFGSIAVAMGLTFIAFEGYEIIAQCGEEVKNPKKNIPRSIFISILIVVPIYILVAFVAIAGVTLPGDYTGPATTNWEYLGELKELAMIHAADKFMPLGGLLFLIGGLFSTMSALNATIYSSSRVSFAMGRDHNLPAIFAKIHPKRKTPYMATILSGIIIIGMALTLPIEEVASAADVMFLLLFVMVNIAVINLRRHRPDLDRGFKVPLMPFIPLVAITSNLCLAGFLFWHYQLGVGVTAGYIILGIIIYLFYSRQKEAAAGEIPTVYEESLVPTEARYRIITPIANPRSIPGLMKFSWIYASYKKAEIVIANIVKVPALLPPSAAQSLLREPKDLIHKAYQVQKRLAPAKTKKENKNGTAVDDSWIPLPVKSIIKISHHIPRAISEAVKEKQANLLILGWRGGMGKRNYFFGSVLDEIVFNAECDVAMMARPTSTFLDKAKRIFVPILIDYKNASLSLEIALALAAHAELPVEAVHVTERHEMENEDIVQFFSKQANDLLNKLNISNIKLKIIHAKNIYTTIHSEVRETDVIIIEGLHERIFKRNFFGEIPERLAYDLDNAVILTKKYPGHIISWFQKIFGTRMPEPHI
jgi:amino acid transporter/nucleotide-binding universal stress UspA family protein